MSGATSNPVEVNQQNNESEYAITRSQSSNGHSAECNSISMASTDDSSVIDSDSDSDIEDITNVSQPSTSGAMLMNRTVDTTNPYQSNILCTNTTVQPNIGSIAIENSSDITFGNKTFYQGPVTIKQFLYDKNDNLGYISGSNNKLGQTHQDHADIEINFDLLDKQRKCSNKQILFWAVLASVLVCSLFILILVVKHPNPVNNGNSSSSGSIGPPTDETPPLRIITRTEWLAQPPKRELPPLELPSTRVIIAHTASDNCTTQAICTERVHTIQKWHMREGQLDDIGFNFLIGGDGAVYVGRGWDTEGVHTKGYNKKSICIAFIGLFFNYAPPKRQLYAAQKMIEEGVKLKMLASNYSLHCQRDLIATESPGLPLCAIVKTWDHWIP